MDRLLSPLASLHLAAGTGQECRLSATCLMRAGEKPSEGESDNQKHDHKDKRPEKRRPAN